MDKDFFFIFAKILAFFDEFSQWIAPKEGPNFEKSSKMVQNGQKIKGLFHQKAEIKLISKKTYLHSKARPGSQIKLLVRQTLKNLPLGLFSKAPCRP